MNIKIPALLFISSVMIFTLTVCNCTSSSDNASDGKTPQATQEPTMISAFEAYDLAVAEATVKYGDVYLDEITAGGGTAGLSSLYEKVDDNGQAANWEVMFKQPGNGTYLIIIVAIENGEVERTYAGDPLENGSSWDYFLKYSLLDIERCQITGAEAVKIADENGGCDYTRIMLRLINGYLGCPHWIVAYGPGTREKGQHPGVTFHIDGETGEIVSKTTQTYNVF